MKKILVLVFIFCATHLAQINTGVSIKPFFLIPGDASPFGFSFDIYYNLDSTNCILVSPGFSSDSRASSYFGWELTFLYKRTLSNELYGLAGIKLHNNNAPSHGVSTTRLKRIIPMAQLGIGTKISPGFSLEGGLLIPVNNRTLSYRSVGYDYINKVGIIAEQNLDVILELGFVILF